MHFSPIQIMCCFHSYSNAKNQLIRRPQGFKQKLEQRLTSDAVAVSGINCRPMLTSTCLTQDTKQDTPSTIGRFSSDHVLFSHAIKGEKAEIEIEISNA